MKLGIEARVGGFVLLALAVLVGFVLALGDFSFAPSFAIYADFAYSGGLQPGSPVKVSGIRIGRVTDLTILARASLPSPATAQTGLGQGTPPVVRAHLELHEDARDLLTDGAGFYVGMQGLIGEAYVELSPGAAGGTQLPEGSAIRGVDAARLHVMALELSSLLSALSTLSNIHGDDGQGLRALGEALTNLLGNVDSMLQEHRTELEGAIADGAASAENLRQLTAGLSVAIGNGAGLMALLDNGNQAAAALRRDLPSLMSRADRSLVAIEQLTTSANKAVNPEEIEKIVSDLRQTMADLHETATQARGVMDTIRRGQGTVGGLIADPQVYDDLKEMLRDLKRNPWKLFWRD
ncbi:MAG: hypothetical protein A2289_01770 [Deltaproteobacteria bacterium RIFOXYA12_FULL_58_15]|nr:MAG: hypothetical protein A2289_01770 [Deltaproteobacteria bacterium RIFOXYA12_FULL_58_15]OGR12503.1 MAG: hypothetical protein A2341_13835 [Deltaproteobacteria bacterium RIFOXYB12_FULL_58_9]